MTSSTLSLDAGRIQAAERTIDPVFLRTPQFVAEALGDRLGFRVLLKVETLNPIRSFKGRGTDLLARQAAADDVLVCASAGNFGQGLAYAGRTQGRAVRVYAAATVDPMRLARMRALGAQVALVDGDFDRAKDVAEEDAARHGWRLVVDGREREIAEGAGTIAVELTGGDHAIDHVVVPVGNGSLICGMAHWFDAASPATQVIAAGAAGAPAMERAWRTGELAVGAPTTTIADGLAARVPVPEAVHTMRASVDRYELVDDEAIVDAMRLLLELCGVVAEPSGAVALAVATALRDELVGATVAVVVGGSNASPETLRRALG